MGVRADIGGDVGVGVCVGNGADVGATGAGLYRGVRVGLGAGRMDIHSRIGKDLLQPISLDPDTSRITSSD